MRWVHDYLGGYWGSVLVAVAAAAAVAITGGVATRIGPWYRALRKPWFQPPDWLFGPAWTVIFGLTAAAGVVAWWRAPAGLVIGLFAANAVLNILWSVLFFTMRRPDWALAEVVLLWLSILVLVVVLWPYAPAASWLLVPYLVWVSFASVLNRAVVKLNAPF